MDDIVMVVVVGLEELRDGVGVVVEGMSRVGRDDFWMSQSRCNTTLCRK